MRRRAIVWSQAFILALLVSSVCRAAPQVRLDSTSEPQRVIAEGLTPGSTAVFFSVSHERPRWMTHIIARHSVETDDDGDGVIAITLDGKVWLQSVWFVVDYATGDYGMAVPDGFPVKEVTAPGHGLQESGGVVNSLQDARRDLEVLLVRPETGVWVLSAGDGGVTDDDGLSNGTIRAAFSAMQPVGSTQGRLQHLQPGDTLVVIDPKSLEFYTTRFPRGGQQS